MMRDATNGYKKTVSKTLKIKYEGAITARKNIYIFLSNLATN